MWGRRVGEGKGERERRRERRVFCRCDGCLNQHDGTGGPLLPQPGLAGNLWKSEERTWRRGKKGKESSQLSRKRKRRFGQWRMPPGTRIQWSIGQGVMRIFLGNEENFFFCKNYILSFLHKSNSKCKIYEESMHQNKTTKPTTFSRLLLSTLVGWKSLWDFRLVGGIKTGNFLKTFPFKHMTDHPKSPPLDPKNSQFLEIKLI